MPVRKAGNFWLTIHDNHRSRQYRRKVIKITDDPLTDREETIGLLCAEIEQLQEENVRLIEILESIKNGGDWLTELNNNQDPSFPTMTLAYAKDCYRKAKEQSVNIKEDK